jgi:hypothetical protein
LPGGNCWVAIVIEAIREVAGQAVDMLAGRDQLCTSGGALVVAITIPKVNRDRIFKGRRTA